MSRTVERVIFVVHGVVTLAAALVLAIFPAAIPATVGITIGPAEYLLSYFLAAAELGIAVLSLGAAGLRDPGAIRLIAVSFAAFHGVTAVLEAVYLRAQGAGAVLVANIVVRVVAAAVFVLLARARR